MERNSRVLGMRIPVEEYEALRALAIAEHRTVGGLALELMRTGQAATTQRSKTQR
jgi:hypothetical protein